jgi:D-alanyl-D-alanine carboxypeptidase/D-alanyl-D-alanine-endopeptidase (penicillin-binding protein 4)
MKMFGRAPLGVALGILLASSSVGQQQEAVPPPIGDQVLDVIGTADWHRAHWGIDVRDAATGERVLGHNAERLFVPASNLKLVVAAAAAHLLGADFRYATEFFRTGPLNGETIEGDLVVYGTGDPNLSGRFDRPMTADLEAFADSLLGRGVRRIEGGIVADVSHWRHEPLHMDWEYYDMRWWYAAPTGPLGFNDNAIDFTIRPGEPGAPAEVSWKPETDSFVFLNKARTSAAGGDATWDFDRIPGTDTIFAYGEMPADARAKTEHFSVRDPALFFGLMLRQVLHERGVEVVRPGVKVIRDRLESGGAEREPLFTYWSRPLPDVLGPILLRSQNWFAEQLLKTLGREISEEGSWEAGLEVVETYLREDVGLDALDFSLRDASGLAGGNLITPAALTEILVHLHGTEAGELVWDALPASAEAVGSLRARFLELPGRVRAKTGHIRNVDSLTGFVRTASGRLLAFSVIVNGTPATSAATIDAIDQVVRLVAKM